MAGRYVILEFDNKDEAEAMIEGIQRGHIDGRRLHRLNGDGLRVTAVFVKPTKFCDCPDKQRQNASNWRKGKRTGLYLCLVCRRPSKHHQTGILKRLQWVFGFNQLEVEAES